MPSLLGTDRGFLMLQYNEVWFSENGFDWRRLASATTDPDLYPSGPDTAVLGGPGLVAVGDDKAWYSVDGLGLVLGGSPAASGGDPGATGARPARRDDRVSPLRATTWSHGD